MDKKPYQFMLTDRLRKRIEIYMKQSGKATISSVIISALEEYLKTR